jgi:hypothetical protein
MENPGITIREIRPDELASFLRVLGDAYGLEVDDYFADAWRTAFDYERNRGLFLNGRLVGTATSGLVHVTTPGPKIVPAACTGNLTVDRAVTIPGLAGLMFRQQCLEHRDEGLPFIVFSVTEAMKQFHIRTGSAPVTHAARLTLTPARFPVARERNRGDIENLSVWSAELYDLHREIAATSVGMIVRERAWMRAVRRLSAVPAEPEVWGYREQGRLRGYAVFRRVADPVGPRTSLVVNELATNGPAACRALVDELLSSGADRVVIENWRLDDPIRGWLGDRATVEQGQLHDALWMRILDVSRALASRAYTVTGQLTMEVADRFLPDACGRFTLEATAGGARCGPGESPVDVRLGSGALAAIYFGAADGRSVLENGLAEACDADAGARFAALFRTDQRPWSGPEW